MAYKKGSKEYADYYGKNPDKRGTDDKLREQPGLMSPQTPTFDPLMSPLVKSTFHFLKDIKKFSEGSVNSKAVEVDRNIITEKVKHIARLYGADLVGVAALNEDDYYSHRGRERENYGERIEGYHKFAIVFAVEMDRDMVDRAPAIEQTVETTKGYVKGAVVGMILSYFFRELGYQARNHMDGNYLLPLPFLAESAGLGEIGRLGILVTKEFGPRVRLGAVTTNLELVEDDMSPFGLAEFCQLCGKCARQCIGKAISAGEPGEYQGKLRWKTDVEKCFEVWQRVGTDCGVCLSVCPFAHTIEGDKVNQMLGNDEVMRAILREHEERYGPYRVKRDRRD